MTRPSCLVAPPVGRSSGVREWSERSASTVPTERSAGSYEREIRSLSQALSDECANSYRLAQEVKELREALDAVALHEHLMAKPTPPSGPAPKVTEFRRRDGSLLATFSVRHGASILKTHRFRRTS